MQMPLLRVKLLGERPQYLPLPLLEVPECGECAACIPEHVGLAVSVVTSWSECCSEQEAGRHPECFSRPLAWTIVCCAPGGWTPLFCVSPGSSNSHHPRSLSPHPKSIPDMPTASHFGKGVGNTEERCMAGSCALWSILNITPVKDQQSIVVGECYGPRLWKHCVTQKLPNL